MDDGRGLLAASLVGIRSLNLKEAVLEDLAR